MLFRSRRHGLGQRLALDPRQIARVGGLAEGIQHHAERALDKGILRAVWMTRDELAGNERLRSPLVLRCIEDHLTGQRFPLSLIHADVESMP